MAGGATYSESRACYEVSGASGKEIFLATSHMITPSLFVQQIGDLSRDRRRLDLPIDRPKPKAPAHIFEREEPKQVGVGVGGPRQAPGLPGRPQAKGSTGSQAQQKPTKGQDDSRQVPTAGLAAMSMNPTGGNSEESRKLEKRIKHSKGESGEKKIKGFFKKMI
jgi:syntaxin-binding protein 1